MRIIQGDLLNVNYGIIGHQVNCKGVMGGGIAHQLRNKYPGIFEPYQTLCGMAIPSEVLLGLVQILQVNPNIMVANLFGQDAYGRDKQYTNTSALKQSLLFLNQFQYVNSSFPVFLPWKLGCGLAGGDWRIVSEIIDQVIPQAIIIQRPEDKE